MLPLFVYAFPQVWVFNETNILLYGLNSILILTKDVRIFPLSMDYARTLVYSLDHKARANFTMRFHWLP
jgi:hypothetical protein